MIKGRPYLFTTLGFPGSGKTYFARKFARQFGVFHLNSDAVRAALFKRPKYSKAEHKVVFGVMDALAGELLKRGASVVYDANLTKREYRKRLQQIAKKNGAGYLLLWFEVPVGAALKRIAKRKELKSKLMKIYHRSVDRFVLFRIRKAIEPPSRSEPYVKINGEQPHREQLKAVLRSIQ